MNKQIKNEKEIQRPLKILIKVKASKYTYPKLPVSLYFPLLISSQHSSIFIALHKIKDRSKTFLLVDIQCD